METRYVSLVFVLILLFHPFTAHPGRNYYNQPRGGGGGGGFARGLGGLIATAAVVKGAFLLGAALSRGKRSADELYGYEDGEMGYASPYEEALNYFDLAMDLDEDTCVQKTVCEIMSSTKVKKNPDTVYKIITTIYSQDSELMNQPGHDGATAFLMSGYFGKNKSKEVCTEAFKLCKRDSESRLKQMQEELELVQKYTE